MRPFAEVYDEMFDALMEAEKQLPELIKDRSRWKSLFVDYHKPYVERVYTDLDNGYRLSLHKIQPCEREEALFHPHPWPQAIHTLFGCYEMGVGEGDPDGPPPAITQIQQVAADTIYVLAERSWHYVAPLSLPSYSIMLTGQPYRRSTTQNLTEKPKMGPLTEEQITHIFKVIGSYYEDWWD